MSRECGDVGLEYLSESAAEGNRGEGLQEGPGCRACCPHRRGDPAGREAAPGSGEGPNLPDTGKRGWREF